MSRGARIALVTWDAEARPNAAFQELALPEDQLLGAALARRGAVVAHVPWSAPDEDWAAHDLILIRTTWDYFDHLEEFRAWVMRAAQLAPVWNPPEVVWWNADKRYLFALEERGVRIPPTVLVSARSTLDLRGLLTERGWTDVVLKRVVAGGAVGQERFGPGEETAAQAHLDSLLAGGDVFVQPYLPSIVARGEVSLIAISGQLVHAVRKVPAPGDYRSQPNFGSRVVRHVPTPAERELAARALDAVGQPTLHARIDMVALEDGAPALMELELIEPYLFLDADAAAAERVAEGIMAHLAGA